MVDSLNHNITSVVINPFFDWTFNRTLLILYHGTTIYEAMSRALHRTIRTPPKNSVVPTPG